MKKHLIKRFSLAVLVFFTLFSTYSVKPAQAYYYDNESTIYYKLSELIYKGFAPLELENALRKKFGMVKGSSYITKYKVIEYVVADNQDNHPMAKPGKLKQSGFQAAAVVDKESKKLFIVFAGTSAGEIFDDGKAALQTTTKTAPEQERQAQLFINYVYKNNKDYQNYKWYFTGHSLGGWLATKLYLDIQDKKWLNSSTKYKYGGAIGKKTIAGVYTFNPLPITKGSVSKGLWDQNEKGKYDSYINNLYIDNEWLNAVSDMHPKQLVYFGKETSKNMKLKKYDERPINYQKAASISENISKYYGLLVVSTYKEAKNIKNAHSISWLSKYANK